MPAGITEKDSLFVVTGGNNKVSWNAERGRPWHGLGNMPEKPPSSIDEAMGPKYSGLHWQIVQEPVLRKRGLKALDIGGKPVEGAGITGVEGYRLNVREDTGEVLGVVGERYRVVQNLEAFQFLSALLGTELAFETGGSLAAGRRVFVVCRLAGLDWIKVGGDEVERFVSFFNSHDGSGAVKVLDTPVKALCQNTWNAALAGAVSSFTIRHVGDPMQELHAAREALSLTIDAGKQFKQWGDKLASQEMTERMMRKVCEQLWPNEGGDRTVKSRTRRRDAVMDLFLHGSTVGNAPGTKWCATNALIENLEWGTNVRTDDGRFTRHIEDPGGYKAAAVNMVEMA